MPSVINCMQCGQPAKSSLCSECKEIERWKEKRPEILNELFPPRIAKKLQQFNIQTDESDINAAQEGGLFIHGKTGVGKTLYASELMVQIVRRYKRRTKGFRFTTMQEMLDQIKEGFDRNDFGGILRQYKGTFFLVLDDLGAERLTYWSYDVLCGIINYRYDWLLPTIITSNLSISQMTERLEDDRLPDRMYEMCQVIYFEGQNRRQGS